MEPDAVKSFLPIEWIEAFDYTLTDSKGRGYIDFTSGIFVANIGHGAKVLCDAIYNQLGWHPLLHAYNYRTPIRTKYTEALCKRTGFECVALFSAGCEPVEAALRVMDPKMELEPLEIIVPWIGDDPSSAYSREMIYRFKNLRCTPGKFMHGKTNAAHLLTPLVENEMPDVPLKGIILESYRGWDAHFWDKKWIQDLRAYCTEHDILLCFDEIQSGFGRTGRFFCYEHYGVEPDLVCIGKAMGGGLPLSGLLGDKSLLDLPGDLSSTHSGNPLACAAGLAVLEEMERLNLVEEAERKGKLLHSTRLWNISRAEERFEYNGAGLVAAILTDTIDQADQIVLDCYKKGLLVVHTGKASVKIGPPLTISDEALGKGLDILEEVLSG